MLDEYFSVLKAFLLATEDVLFQSVMEQFCEKYCNGCSSEGFCQSGFLGGPAVPGDSAKHSSFPVRNEIGGQIAGKIIFPAVPIFLLLLLLDLFLELLLHFDSVHVVLLAPLVLNGVIVPEEGVVLADTFGLPPLLLHLVGPEGLIGEYVGQRVDLLISEVVDVVVGSGVEVLVLMSEYFVRPGLALVVVHVIEELLRGQITYFPSFHLPLPLAVEHSDDLLHQSLYNIYLMSS